MRYAKNARTSGGGVERIFTYGAVLAMFTPFIISRSVLTLDIHYMYIHTQEIAQLCTVL